jgi:cell division transport system ATP-binding protein
MTLLPAPRNKAVIWQEKNCRLALAELAAGAAKTGSIGQNRGRCGAMVRFDDVWLKYRRGGQDPGSAAPDVIAGMSFDIPDGGFRWLTGASGAGKTSVLKLMYLSEHPTRGRIDILGTDAARLNRRDAAFLRRRIGVVYQDFRLLGHLSVYDNVALPMRLARKTEAQVRADVTELLRWVGLTAKLDVLPAELSGGEQQRIAIARAVVGRPKLLLADEPTGNLDDDQAERLMLLITALNRLGTTVVVATHNLGLVARYPAPLLEIAGGRLVGDG